MTAAAAVAPGDDVEGAAPKKGGKKKLIVLLAIPLVLAGVGAGLWFGGILPPLLGMGPKPAADAGKTDGAPGDGQAAGTGAGQGGSGAAAIPAHWRPLLGKMLADRAAARPPR